MKSRSLISKILFCSIIMINFNLPLFARDLGWKKVSTGWKEWSKCSDEEKESLKGRWARDKINMILEQLIKIKQSDDTLELNFPEFVKISPGGYYDLRGINLYNRPLDSLILNKMDLGGADLTEAHLNGANLKGSCLQYVQLRNAKMQHANCEGANLQYADLSKAFLDTADFNHANLQNAIIRDASLQGANLSFARLDGADLMNSKLQGAILSNANLQNADLSYVSLDRADLTSANLKNTEFMMARFDSTFLRLVNFDKANNIRYIIWGNQVKPRCFISNEIDTMWKIFNYGRNSKERKELDIESQLYEKVYNEHRYMETELTYRDLKELYKNALMYDIAKEFQYRENEVITRRSLLPVRIFRVFFLKYTYGYGSRPFWLFPYSLVVILMFALIYILITLISHGNSGVYLVQKEGDKIIKEEILQWQKGALILNCLYFSVLSFCTFGWGTLKPGQWVEFLRLKPVEYKPVLWARICVGIEAVLGIYLLALLGILLFGRA